MPGAVAYACPGKSWSARIRGVEGDFTRKNGREGTVMLVWTGTWTLLELQTFRKCKIVL